MGYKNNPSGMLILKKIIKSLSYIIYSVPAKTLQVSVP